MVETKRRGPAVAARLSGRAELFKERLDRERLKDPETGVEYLLSTQGPTVSRMVSPSSSPLQVPSDAPMQ